MAPKENTNKTTSPRTSSSSSSSSHLSGAMIKQSVLSPGFRSVAAMAGWDEEALLLASLVVEDTPVRESRHKRRSNPHLKSPPSTSSNRKRRSRRRSTNLVPPVVLSLDDDELSDKKDSGDARKEMGTIAAEEKKKKPPLAEGASPEKLSSNALPCMDRLREELSCAICLEICFEPSTTPCGHSFCMKCLKCAAAKCGKRCPKCRQLISNGRSCTVNTVLWNTIQLLFPEEVGARKSSTDPKITSDQSTEPSSEGSERSNSDITRSSSMRSYTQVSETMDRVGRRRAAPSRQSEDAALAYRLQREEFMVAFRSSREEQRSALYAASANLRSMASRAIHLRTRSRHS
ncbi:LON peptidase N-terminal domain and RING finger protein 3-like [Ananas comosus]|uniref:RING-type E3 ubiquitin transferase n=1 Tax=Ananas comosus TaxID=4615 RepID=A0A6P5GPE4_ANACO|nr:LON peptidase N-terminal domain and RING finger protein 3-like [Ananas comosus]